MLSLSRELLDTRSKAARMSANTTAVDDIPETEQLVLNDGILP